MMPKTTVTVQPPPAATPKPFTFSEMKAAPAGSVFRPVGYLKHAIWFVVAVRNVDTGGNTLMYVTPGGTFETMKDSPEFWDRYTFVKANAVVTVTFSN